MHAQPVPPEPPRPDVIRPLSRAAVRTCARPGCPSPASATLTFAYQAREVLLFDLADDGPPASYDLCVGHAERTVPPNGWSLDDRRRAPEDGSEPPDGEGTVALIARVLGRDRHETGAGGRSPRPAEVPRTPAHGGPQAVETPADPTQGRLFGGDDGTHPGGRADAW